MINEFLHQVKTYSVNIIKGILVKFIINNCTFGSDEFYRKYYLENRDHLFYDLRKTEYFRRLILGVYTRDCAWESLTWILNQLPFPARKAIRVIEVYYLANIQFLTEDQLVELSECITIIPSKFINIGPVREQLLELNTLEFEMLVSKLYKSLRYSVRLTKRGYGGVVDIIAGKTEITQKETLLIQDKRYKEKISVKDIRELLGTVSDGKATKSTLITTAIFTKAAIKFVERNPRIELIIMKILRSRAIH